jgi:alpha-N-acetylglucosamine transferase
MITQEELNKYIKAQEVIDKLNISGFDKKAKEICHILGHTGYDKINYIDNDTVCCQASYSGGYDEEFDFPVKLMIASEKEIKEYKKNLEEKERKREQLKKKEREKQKIIEEKKLLSKLKAKYE